MAGGGAGQQVKTRAAAHQERLHPGLPLRPVRLGGQEIHAAGARRRTQAL